MENVLLTGASGFLGKIINRELNLGSYNVITLGRSQQSLTTDITQPFKISKDKVIDLVVHCAGKAHSIPRTAKEDEEFFNVNYKGTINLCTALDQLETKPKAFVFISTVSVYGLDFGSNIKEDHPLNGTTSYAKSKIQAEEYLQEWAANNNIILSVLRLPLIAGPYPPGNLGVMIKGIKSGKYLSIGKAEARKSIVWGQDIAEIIPKLVDTGGIYNLTDGYHPSFGELESSISNALGKSKPFAIPMFVAKTIAYIGDVIGAKFPINSNKLNKITSTLTFDDSKVRKELGWNPSDILNKVDEMV